MTDMEQINRATWRPPLSLREYRRLNGYITTGEESAFGLALEEGRKRILDIGVGAGRTAGLLAYGAESYLGIYYTPEMIELASASHPHCVFEHMDARDLSSLASGSFDLVAFSYNGIDSVDPQGRTRIMAEVARVLAPNGLFVFSSFHRGWQGFRKSLPFARRIVWTANPVKLGLRFARLGCGFGEASLRRLRYARLEQRVGVDASLLHSAHDFGILIYATTPAQIEQQLCAAGFAGSPVIIGELGNRIVAGDDISREEHFNIVARKSVAQ